MDTTTLVLAIDSLIFASPTLWMILYFNSNSSLAKSIIQNQVYSESCLSNITQHQLRECKNLFYLLSNIILIKLQMFGCFESKCILQSNLGFTRSDEK
jgi:hypothetical protein